MIFLVWQPPLVVAVRKRGEDIGAELVVVVAVRYLVPHLVVNEKARRLVETGVENLKSAGVSGVAQDKFVSTLSFGTDRSQI